MPVFDIVCKDCEFLIEDSRLSFDDVKNINENKEIDVECPKCSSKKFKKLMAAHGKFSSNWSKW